MRCLARHFVAFGGLPLMAVFDRPRTIVKRSGRGRDVEQYNATFAQAIVDIGVLHLAEIPERVVDVRDPGPARGLAVRCVRCAAVLVHVERHAVVGAA